MILQGFKQKSNKKYLNSLLDSREVLLNEKKIVSLGVVLNIDEVNDFETFRRLANAIKVKPNKLKIIAFTSNKKDELNSWDVCFNPKDFGWHGKIKNIELQEFIETPFDALISYYTEEILELKLITAASQAKFKIGILQTDNRLNDFIIKTNLKQFNIFQKELIKYLNIFNKIKNE
ncbi:DUF6913 domain-containing protein [Lacinutrix iliipiscaria]|uniref:DUF6913 domain-containing protein n=1 Tax=Lacinutrix iliipiscaria TaxID=1230532 RepID=A0ABW5WNP2_9FLAO